MKAKLAEFWLWCKAKYGRIVTAAGFVLSGVETFDISPIRDPLESVIGHIGVSIATIACFVLSFIRHQQVANKHPSPPPSDGK